jgi:hypothetical protein
MRLINMSIKHYWYGVVLNCAVITLLAGCFFLPNVIIDYIDNDLAVQITVINETSSAVNVVLHTANGRKRGIVYQWELDKFSAFASSPTEVGSGLQQEIQTVAGKRAYEGFQVGDEILSFLLVIDGKEYAGWDVAAYGNGGRTLDGQGYGYAILGENAGEPGWHSKYDVEAERASEEIGFSPWLTAEYTVTVRDTGIEWVLNQVAYTELPFGTPATGSQEPE